MADVGDNNSRADAFATRRSRKARGVEHPGMMGDETEEQSLGEEGDPEARIGEEELEESFGASSPRLPRFWAGFATGVVAALAASRLLSRD
jgi:hypothetical protein